jgi:hypothetical protein
VLVDIETGDNRLTQRRPQPLVHLLGERAGQLRMPGEGASQGRDPTRLLHQPAQPVCADVRGSVGGQGCQDSRFAFLDDGVGDAAAELGTASDRDLVLKGGFYEHPEEILVPEDRAREEDRSRDLYVIAGEEIDQLAWSPVGARQSLGQGAANLSFRLLRQRQEDLAKNRREFSGRRAGVAQRQNAQEQPLTCIRARIASQRQQVLSGGGVAIGDG